MQKIENSKKSNGRFISHLSGINQEPSAQTLDSNFLKKQSYWWVSWFKINSFPKRAINTKLEFSNQEFASNKLIKQVRWAWRKWAFKGDVFLIELKTKVFECGEWDSQKDVARKQRWWI